MFDYKGRLTLTIIVRRFCKNGTWNFILSDQILGCIAGNDISALNFRVSKAYSSLSCYTKPFDAVAAIGPWIVSSGLVPDPRTLKYITHFNWITKQDILTSNIIWSIKKIFQHLSQGIKICTDIMIMTGALSRVRYLRKEFLRNGDMIEA